MQLEPKHPPGLKRRKVRAFAVEIRRLQAEGYTCEEIRQALADIGVLVSRSTVQREAAHRHAFAVSAQQAFMTERSPSSVPEAPVLPELKTPPTGAPPSSGVTGREIAEAFFDAHPSNPLFAAKETS